MCVLSSFEGRETEDIHLFGRHQKTASSVLRSTARLLLGTICCASVLSPALAQSDLHSSEDKIGWVPRAILERPVPLRQGIGNLHEKVTTSSPQAQAFYDQGLDYYYGWDWIEAVRSFNQALRLDPDLAMAYIGLSEVYTQLQDTAAAQNACSKAQSLSGKLSELDRTRIQIRADQLDFLAHADSEEKYFTWRNANSNALTANPMDWELWIQLGDAIGVGGGIEPIADFEAALAFSPDNSAAHHMLAHAFENIGQMQQALAQAEAFERLAPSIPHAHHMVGHELRRLGHTEESIQQFLKAKELQDAYYHTENISAKYDWHDAHNLELLALSYEALGQMKAAEPFFQEAFSLPAYTDTAAYYRREWPDFLLENGRLEESLNAAEEMIADSTSSTGRVAGYESAGRVLLALNRSDEAKNELQLAEREMERLPADLTSEMPASEILRGAILLHDQKQPEADVAFKKIEAAIEAQSEPDIWMETLFQLQFIAQVARQYGDWKLADFTARQMIKHDPSYAGGYYELGLAMENSGDTALARRQFQMAEKLWSTADPDLTQLVRLRKSFAP
jgi:tetratricopeptide (TPR) repeat protein